MAGTNNCIINVHLLRHLVHYVQQYGPLWTHSCFPFEGFNGKLLKLHHETQHILMQVSIKWNDHAAIAALAVPYRTSIFIGGA